MSNLKYCQGPDCHTYFTQDRVKGIKGSKTNQTRRRSSLHWGEFCDNRCYNDWFRKYGKQAVNYFGRLTEPKKLTKQNAWIKNYDWRANADDSHSYFIRNELTNERRPITEEQYNDQNYTLNT